MSRKKNLSLMILMGAILIALALACLCIGKYQISLADCIKILFGGEAENPMDKKILMGVRLPRVLATIMVGGSLALSGSVFQGVFKNPLVSPDFLGVTAGACVGAALGILASFGGITIQIFAFCGGLIAVLITLSIPKLIRSTSNIILVLSGIIVAGAMSSILGFIKYIADPETELAAITYWQLGSFAYVDMKSLLSVLPITVVAAGILIAMAFWINILSLGEKEAQTLGVNVSVMRGICLILATVLTAGAVCIAGTVGWVGLVIPHFTRMIVGSNNKRLLPAACIVGGIFMLVVDTVTRVIGPAEMPISILTGLIGAPFYAWLLYTQRNRLQ